MKKIDPKYAPADMRDVSEDAAAGKAGSPKIVAWGHQGPIRDALTRALGGEKNPTVSGDGVTHIASPSADHPGSIALLPAEEGLNPAHCLIASCANAGIILIDIKRGVDHVIRMQSVVFNHMGIEPLIAIVAGDSAYLSKIRFDEIADDFRAHAVLAGLAEFEILPLVPFKEAVSGDRDGVEPPVFSAARFFENAANELAQLTASDFRLAVDEVVRGENTRVSGTVLGGVVTPGDRVVALPSSGTTDVLAVEIDGVPHERAERGDTEISLSLDGDVDVAEGQVVAAADGRPELADQVSALLLWSDMAPMLPGRPYLIELAGQSTTAAITDLKFKESYDNLQQIAARRLHKGELGQVNMSFADELAFDAYERNPASGFFVLKDKMTGADAGFGLVRFGLRRATNIHRQAIELDAPARAAAKSQMPCCIWFTGLSGSGKSTIANAVEMRLHGMGRHTYILDGDNVRHGLNRDLGFKDADRVENIRRIGEVAKLMVDAGLIVMTAFISPFRSERRMARGLFREGEFIEVFVKTPLEICEARDPKGLYKKARAGQVANFTGIDSAYEPPEAADIVVDGGQDSVEQLVDDIIAKLNSRGLLKVRSE